MGGSNRADFQGGPDEVRHAKMELQKILKFYFPQECVVIDLPPESVDWIAGEDDRELMRLQSGGAIVSLDRGAASMWLCGNPKSVDMARNRIRNSLQRWDREHASISLQTKNQCFAIIGSGGSTIRELQSSTGARIDVDANNLHVMISGKEESVREARARVMEIVNNAGKGSSKGGYRDDERGMKGNSREGKGGKGGFGENRGSKGSYDGDDNSGGKRGGKDSGGNAWDRQPEPPA